MSAFSNANHNTFTRQPRMRRTLVATACVIALSGLAVPGAMAQSTDYFLDLTIPPVLPSFTMSNYADSLGPNQINTGPGSATNTDTMGSRLVGPGSSPTPVTVTGNSVMSVGAGNTNTNGVSLNLIRNPTGSTDGIGTLASQLEGGNPLAPSGVYTATVAAGQIVLVETSLPAATLSLTNNTIAATVSLNKSDSMVGPVTTNAQGLLPVAGYDSTQKGSISAGLNDTPAAPLDDRAGGLGSQSTGSVNIVTHQTALNASALSGSVATVTSDGAVAPVPTVIGLSVLAPTTGLTAPLTVTGNSVSAAFDANQSTNIFNAMAGSSIYTGSVAVTNAQANIELVNGATAGTAIVDNSSITANVRYAGPLSSGTGTVLTAPLVVSNNSLSASSGGNTAGERTASGSVLAGNAIVFGQGNNVYGTDSGNTTNLSVKIGELSAGINADLALLNAQGNQGTALYSSVDKGNVTVTADQVGAGGSITANQNNVAASASGNLAGNLIATDATNFAATAAAANLQINEGTAVEAHNLTASVTVGAGYTGLRMQGPLTASENTLGARAEGNVAATTVALKSTNLSTSPAAASAVTANTQALDPNWGTVSNTAGVAASNLQVNSRPSNGIVAELSGQVAIAVATDNGTSLTPVAVSSAPVTLEKNVLSGAATGNQASTGVTLSGTNGSVQAAVGNTQVHDGDIGSTVTDSGVSALVGAVWTSAITVNENVVSSEGTANSGTNRLSASFTNLGVSNNTFAAGAGATSATGTAAATGSAFGIASSQYNMAGVSATNSSTDPFAVIYAGQGTAAPTAGNGTANNLTVNSNAATASTTGNLADNALSLTATNLSTAGNAAVPLAGLANLQVNEMGANEAVAEVTNTGSLAIGIAFVGDVTSSNLTANANKLTATTLGNKATNRVGLDGVANFAPTSAGSTTGQAVVGTGNSVTSDFALANTQLDAAVARTATAGGSVGLNVVGAVPQTPPVITTSNLSVQSNQITAEARNNDASNSMAFANGMATLGSSALVSNLQASSTPVSASVNTDVGLLSSTNLVEGSNLTVSANQALGLAVGSSAASSLNAAATNLSGNANITALSGGSAFNPAANLTVNADYGVANRQSQGTGQTPADVGSTVAAFMGINAPLAVVVPAQDGPDSSLAVTGNKALAYAQGTSANNAEALSGTNVSGVTGAVASIQTTNGNMTADASGSVAVIVTSTTDTPVVVSDNRMLAAAGQNEATNGLSVVATNISGGSKGNNISAYNPSTGVASARSDFSVLNVQSGTGDVDATTTGNMWIGATTITGGSATVNNNSLTAKANFNTAANALVLNAGATMAATGGIHNVQTTGANSAGTATVTGGVGLGDVPVVPPFGTLSGTVATVAGNSLTAEAGGNAATNALTALAGATIANGGVATSQVSSNPATPAESVQATFAVLNYQGNNAAMSASVAGGYIGMNPGSISGTTATVQNNQMLASAYGNTANNQVALSVLTAGANQASSAISNVQYNTASISAAVSAATTGVFGGSTGVVTGGVVVVSGNSSTAQAMGNVAVNRIVSR